MPLLTHIPQLLEEHFEELSFLLHFRSLQVGSPRMLYRQLIDLDDRIEGHIAGLLAVPGEAAALAQPLLAGKDPLDLRAAAFLLLHLDPQSFAEKIVARLAAGEPPLAPPLAAALVDALLMAPAPQALAALKPLLKTPASLSAAQAAEVLAQHSPRDVNAPLLAALLTQPDPAARTLAWQAAQRLPEARPVAQYRAGIADPHPAVRDAALLAAAWTAGPAVPLLDSCRPFLKKMTPENGVPLRLWATLAPPQELAASDLPKAIPLGPVRFELLACSGAPAIIPHLLAGMRQDPPSASAAANAFTRLTGYQPPDADAAQRYWQGLEPQLAGASRIHRGQPIEPGPLAPAALLEVDCAAREEILLRQAALSERAKAPSAGSRWLFPQRFPA
jgi:hypothetical protein